MTGWLTTIGAFVGAVVPILLGIRFTRAARLRRSLEVDLGLAEKAADVETKERLSELTRHEARELLARVQVGAGLHPAIIMGLALIGAGAIVYLLEYIGQPERPFASLLAQPTREIRIGVSLMVIGAVVAGLRLVGRFIGYTRESWNRATSG